MNIPAVSVIGTGALGSTLARAFRKQDIHVKSIYNRSLSKSRALAEKIGIDVSGTFPEDGEELGKLLFLTVPDDFIADVAERLSPLRNSWAGYSVVHCSGNESSAALSSLRERGAGTAAFHPLQTFTGASSPSAFKGIYFSMEGDPELLALLRELAGLLEARVMEVTPEAKGYLHAAAVMASNYLIALLHASDQIAELGGMDAAQVRSALLPLVRQSLENAGTGSLSEALSGPVARGDSGTVSRHLEMLKPDADLLLIYKQLGKQALKLARQKGTLSSGQVSELEKLLSPDGSIKER